MGNALTYGVQEPHIWRREPVLLRKVSKDLAANTRASGGPQGRHHAEMLSYLVPLQLTRGRHRARALARLHPTHWEPQRKQTLQKGHHPIPLFRPRPRRPALSPSSESTSQVSPFGSAGSRHLSLPVAAHSGDPRPHSPGGAAGPHSRPAPPQAPRTRLPGRALSPRALSLSPAPTRAWGAVGRFR